MCDVCWSKRPGTTDMGHPWASSFDKHGQSPRVIAIADRAQQRLCRRYHRLTEHGKPPNKAVVAIARELVGFIWAVLNPVHEQAA